MPWNGAGSFQISTSYFPEAAGNIVDATRYNSALNDLATGIGNCLARDGQNTPVANIPMAGYRFTGMGEGTAAGQPVTWNQAANVSFSGNMGLGTTTIPTSARLVVTSTGIASQIVALHSPTLPTASGQRIGGIGFGVDGETTAGSGARIEALSEGAWTSNTSSPTYLIARTTPAGSTTPVERLRLDSIGNFGIGTQSPGAKLEIAGLGNAAEIRLRSTDTTTAVIRSYVNAVEVGKLAFMNGGSLSIETAGGERVRIDSAGNVGFNAIPKSWNANYTALDNRVYQSLYSASSGASGLVANAYFDSVGWKSKSANYAVLYQQDLAAGAHLFYTTPTGAVGANVDPGFIERMRIDTSGGVGIGGSAVSSALLDVQSTTRGLRLPNMTTAQKNAIASPSAGLLVFDTSLGKACLYTGSAWQTITSV